jgi:hypothetical protein
MSTLRQLTRSSRRKGGSLSRSWVANKTFSRIDFFTRNPPGSRMKKRSSLVAETSAAIDSGYSPSRAKLNAVSCTSVAKILTFAGPSRCAACSASSIASEYASSPVADPATQTRTSSSGPFPANSPGTTCRASPSNASRSRKKLVTQIRKSLRRVRASSGLSCSTPR